MTDSEKRARLNEIGKEIAKMFPNRRGSVTFYIRNCKFKGIKEENNIEYDLRVRI